MRTLGPADLCAILFAASYGEIPEATPEANESFDRASVGKPLRSNRRSTRADVSRVRCRADGLRTIDAVKRLAGDPANPVRFMVASNLALLRKSWPSDVRHLTEDMATADPSPAVANAAICTVLGRMTKDDLGWAVDLAAKALERFPPSEQNAEVRGSIQTLILRWFLWTDQPVAQRQIAAVVGDPVAHSDFVQRIPLHLRDVLSVQRDSPQAPADSAVRRRAWDLLTTLSRAAAQQWTEAREAIREHHGRSPEAALPDELRGRYDSLCRLLVEIAEEIGFASGAMDERYGANSAGRKVGGTPSIVEARRRFLDDAVPILNDLEKAGIVLAVHRIVEFLATYADVDPEQVFLRISRLVKASVEYPLESIAKDEIVRLVERYLAEFRHVLQSSPNCQDALIGLLDAFVAWPAAWRLTYRLGESLR